MNTRMKKMAAALAVSGAAFAAQAAPIVLTFEGVGDLNAVGNFYASQGIMFSPATLAVVDADAGGNGNFANEPSPSTAMFFLDSDNAILNFAAGFSTGFSFFYSSATSAVVKVYDDINGAGNSLGSLQLTAQHADNCSGDPTGAFCNWSAVGITFTGIAKSINFGGAANQTAFDDITFGDAIPGGPVNNVPAPATLALFGVALAGMGVVRRRRAVGH